MSKDMIMGIIILTVFVGLPLLYVIVITILGEITGRDTRFHGPSDPSL
jgi:hypothetical protein